MNTTDVSTYRGDDGALRAAHEIALLKADRDRLQAIIDGCPEPDWTETILRHPWPVYYRDHIAPAQSKPEGGGT